MATPKKPLSIKSGAVSSSEQAASTAESAAELQAEYQQRQRSPRPLPASIAKAYEVLIAREEPEQQSTQDAIIGRGHQVTS